MQFPPDLLRIGMRKGGVAQFLGDPNAEKPEPSNTEPLTARNCPCIFCSTRRRNLKEDENGGTN